MASFKQILIEEVEMQTEKYNFNQNEISKVINELFSFDSSKLLRNLGDQDEILNDKDMLPNEFWQELLDVINESFNESKEEWAKDLKAMKLKILCYKYFTRKDLEKLESIEKNLRLEIKKYYSSLLNYTSLEDFKDRFFNLPAGLLFTFTRFLLNGSKELSKKLKVSKDDFKKEIKRLKEERQKIIKKVAFLSNRNITSLNLSDIKDLVDTGVFYEDNLLNRGVNEYFFKLSVHKKASEAIKDSFNSTFLSDLKTGVETSNAYLNHISSIKSDEEPEYFSPTGIQIGRRFDMEIENLESKDFSDSVIDKDSVYQEPKGRIKNVPFPSDSEGMAPTGDAEGGEGGGDAGGGGGMGGGPSGGGGGGGGGGLYAGPEGGDETVDLDAEPVGANAGEGGEEGGEMPKDENGLPTDFGTPESNATGEEPEEKPKN